MSEIYIMDSKIPFHLLNVVNILSPRWHDRVILPRVDKFRSGGNLITIRHPNWPSRYYMHSKTLSRYKTELKYASGGKPYRVYVIPLDDLKTVQEVQEILDTVDQLFKED